MICQVCSAPNELDRELCRKCQSKLLVVSGSRESYDEGSLGGGSLPDDGISLDEHLLERVSVLEEIVKRCAETLKLLLDSLNRQEKNGFVAQAGLLAMKDLLERKGVVAEGELLDLWEARVDHHMAAVEKRERFVERRERLVAAYAGDKKERFLELLRDAELALFALETDKALKLLEEAHRLDRGNAELAFFLGETYFNEGDADRAGALLRQVLSHDPRHFEALVYAGVLENEAGRSERAIDSLKRAVAVKPDAFLPHFALGALLALSGQLPKAETFLERAVEIEENGEAWSLLGTIAYERGRLKQAIDAFQKAVRLDPEDEESLYQLGLCYLDRGWTQKAAERFQAALELNPNRLEFQEASKLLAPGSGRALPKVSGEAADLAQKAQGLAAQEPQKALAIYRRALKIDPENPTLLIAYALLCSSVGRTSEAVQTTRRVLAREPGEMVAAAAYATLLEALKAEGKYREGSRVAEEMLGVVRSNYARSIAYFQRATALAEMGEDLDGALHAADLSLRLSPKEMRQFPLAAKGWVHYKRREFASAVDCLKRATDLGETPAGLTQLGLAYLALGDLRAARQAFGRAKRKGGRASAARGRLESKMLEQIRRSLRLDEKMAQRGRKPGTSR
ncbi:MAG: tetratricopeptide repeat protein [Acidobacteria bacterium]|nr:tetratricopeptide repeat protein [Acidobacteriota bacterium]